MRTKPTDVPPALPEHVRHHRAAQARGHREWEVDEICKVVSLYPNYEAMQEALPHRSYSALRNAADRWAARTRRHVWTTVENARLRRIWPTEASKAEILAAFPGITWEKLVAHARWMGLGRRTRRFKEFDVTVLDKIRQRAEDDGFTLIDLDRLAGTGRYFQKSNRKLVPKHIVKATIAFGGTWDIDWNDEA